MQTTPRRPAPRRGTPRLLERLVLPLAMVLLLVGCGANGATPPNHLPRADDVVKQLAAGLATGDIDQVPTASPGAQSDLTTIMAGMDGLRPQVGVGPITYDGGTSSASATLHQTYLLGAQKFAFDSTAHLVHAASGWQVQWSPTIVHPQLSDTTRLRHTRVLPPRAPIMGARNTALVEPRPVYHLGVDKQLAGANSAKVAAQLAAILTIDAAAYQKRVAAAGAKAFVVAETIRQDQLPVAAQSLVGVRWMPDTASLALNATFAQALLGTMGAPTAKQVQASAGDITADDQVGLSGLEARYDAQLRGTVGHTIDVVARTGTGSSGSPTAAPSASGGALVDATLFSSQATPGKPLVLSLDADLQQRAEKVLSAQSGIAAMVVLNQATGGVLAAANSPATNGQPIATTGQVPPGSTIKIADSLALIRQGYTASSSVSCPSRTAVNGKAFTNDSWYPASATGTIPLSLAVAQSCNTAFVGLAGRVSQAQQLAAASSLGMGTDYASGFSSFYGSIPATSDAVMHAADMIGQGQVTASPLAMAGVAASVGAGHTVIPNLVVGNAPKSTAAPLTASEAGQLQTIMKAVVNGGTGSSLRGLAIGAKTGTAEYAAGSATKTHAWMICYTGTYAISVMVYDGQTGAGTAGPLVSSFLQAR